MFRSATFKLTIWYLAIVMAICLVFSLVVYHVASGDLASGLQRQSQRIYDQFPVFDNDPILHPGEDVSRSDKTLLYHLVYLNLIVLLAAGGASYLLARRTLFPIEAAHEQQKRFVADVSHELRTPLTAIRMESEVALFDAQIQSKELQATLRSNLEEVAKLEKLINNLLKLSRLEAQEIRQGFSLLDGRQLAEAALEEAEKLAAKRGIILDTKLSKATLYGDMDSLRQVLLILLDNAIKYSEKGGRVSLTMTRHKELVSYAITDQGPGIAAADLERIFDRFYRSDASRNKTTVEGYGLGLSIAKLIADVHGATILIRSAPGRGTTAELQIKRSSSSSTS